MKFINIKGVSFIVLFIWFEIIIFSIALIGGNTLANFVFYLIELFFKKDLYSSSINMVNSIRLMIIFGLISISQNLFITSLMKIIKNKVNLMIYFFNVCLVLAFVINKLLSKTALKSYSFLWFGFMLSFILGSYELILTNRRFFIFSCKKIK